ncbi:hypothetical protein J41TS12_25430 [Paenibacillus antibioticophila]|uniref:DNA-binding response regulator n=1 Tax=Paenibacillus antibioticophila TaxID=1274374 RepID=A0A919XR34_9BACL|nr:response regulator [Paenibacillus antibioticophila]GIO37682.1 hypothetical protein J41TS12_25430 [Paenibacillus antibioticophila]
MIRVLIVDDDKLVRKGLISAMPWQQFEMEVVGEANNGENALKFMEANPVDLLMTDLSMPVMSGIELMRIVRERYRQVRIVVLTLHQDFEYIQEALRLGAIDYIAKIQLEKEQFEEVLGRVSRLMKQKESGSTRPDPDGGWEKEGIAALQLCYTLNSSGDVAESVRVPPSAVEAEPGVWYWHDEKAGDGDTGEGADADADTCAYADADAEYQPGPGVARVMLTGLEGLDRKTILQVIRSYKKHDLFYDYEPSSPVRYVDARELVNRNSAEQSPSMDSIRDRWSGTEWIYEDQLFYKLLLELKGMRLPSVRLIRIFISLSDEWNRLYRPTLEEPITMEDYYPSWYSFELWLAGTRDQIRLAGAKQQLSLEIRSSLDKAMNLARQNLSQSISTGEIAQLVNMSSSYFSQCFKQYTGQTFADYVRVTRMEQAKSLLRNTSRTIQWIAEQCGYNDEKYFSRLFREQVGLLPSEYRQQASSSGQ